MAGKIFCCSDKFKSKFSAGNDIVDKKFIAVKNTGDNIDTLIGWLGTLDNLQFTHVALIVLVVKCNGSIGTNPIVFGLKNMTVEHKTAFL